MEKTKLIRLFDRQAFEGNPCLAAIISDVESRYAVPLSDDDLTYVNAAGEVEPTVPSEPLSDGTEEDPL